MKFLVFLALVTLQYAAAKDSGEGRGTEVYALRDMVEYVAKVAREGYRLTDCVFKYGWNICTNREGAALNYKVEEALQNGCATCTGEQREITARILEQLSKNEKLWKVLVDKYDPQRIYSPQYEKA